MTSAAGREDNLRRDTDGRRIRRHVVQHHAIGANSCVCTDRDATEYLGPGPYIYVTSDFRRTIVPAAERNLLE
jgi:hypothetical protein